MQLRADISETLQHAVSSRLYAQDEAERMSENVSRHYNKATVLLAKLREMLDHYPNEEPKSTVVPRSPTRVRAKPVMGEDGKKIRRHRIPRVTVPGEVLAPHEIEYDTDSDGDDVSTDDDSDIYATGRRTPMMPRIKLVSKGHKPSSRLARPITYSSAALSAAAAANAAALLNPPPENAAIGSADAPWLQLTQYELAKLRKRMKKNATWTPSETMVARELKQLGRGPDEYREAKRKAEAEGKEFTAAVPTLVTDGESGTQQLPAGAISVEAFESEDVPMSNRGMKLNEAKKLKREALAKLAAEEAEESARKMAHAAKMFMGSPEREKAAGKRKRGGDDSEDDELADTDEAGREREETTPPRPSAKRSRVETPVLPPHRPGMGAGLADGAPPLPGLVTPGGTVVAQAQTPVPIPVPPRGTSRSVASPTPSATTITTTIAVKPPAQTPVPLPRTDRRKSTTPVMPPTFEPYSRRETRGAAQRSPEESSRPNRAASRGLTPRPASRGKATSQEPTGSAVRQPTRRAKRPAPGVVSTTVSGGSSAVGKRKSATKKKARASKKGKEEEEEVEMEEVDDDGNPIDPDEPRYCLCNRVSFGTMIQCDNLDVGVLALCPEHAPN